MIKFKLDNKGSIYQEFGGSPSTNPTQYTSIGIKGHSGIDTGNGWDTPVPCDNTGYVYKIAYAEKSPSNWQAVYMLVEEGKDIVEVCYGHLNQLYARPGEILNEGSYVGTEGNHGYVFSGGTEITPQMQKASDHRGHHLHTSYRPVKKVTERKRTSRYYLLNTDGSVFKRDGFYYEIINTDNGYNGCINPRNYLYKNSNEENLGLIAKILQAVKSLKK